MSERLDGPARTGRRELLRVLRALRDGDFSARLPEGEPGLPGEIAATVNDLARRNQPASARRSTGSAADLGRRGSSAARPRSRRPGSGKPSSPASTGWRPP